MRALLLVCLLLQVSAASAHAIKSAQWRLTQLDVETWESRLRLPEDFEGRLLSVQPKWPDHCRTFGEMPQQPVDEGIVMRWRMHCPGGLYGRLGLSGFSVQLPDAVLLIEPLQGGLRHAVLSVTQPEWDLESGSEPPPVAHYLGLGVEHILLGPDHLLFVLGLWALWRRSRRSITTLVATLTAFTVAHSVTLAGAALGQWRLPVGAVEACIAGSILLLAVELATDARGFTSRHPALIAFGFGLLHGFGFAGALGDIGLPEHARIWALAAFNLGVEGGQLLFVCLLMLLARTTKPLHRWAPVALSAYGAVAAYWLIERSLAVTA